MTTKIRVYAELTADGDLNVRRRDDDHLLAALDSTTFVASGLYDESRPDFADYSDDSSIVAELLALLLGVRGWSHGYSDMLAAIRFTCEPGAANDDPAKADFELWKTDEA